MCVKLKEILNSRNEVSNESSENFTASLKFFLLSKDENEENQLNSMNAKHQLTVK